MQDSISNYIEAIEKANVNCRALADTIDQLQQALDEAEREQNVQNEALMVKSTVYSDDR